jgi:putative tryptophan/tyrosine transport system substrate-binding protein
MKRRDFISLLGSAAATWQGAAQAQQRTEPVIGFLHTGSADGFAEPLRAFRQGLSETGFVDGRNVTIEFRWADGQNERLLDLATDLVRRRLNVIVATGGERAARTVQAVMASPPTIPIVFMAGGDPVQAGLVASLNRPGRNLTGVTTLTTDLVPKRLEMLHEAVPTARKIAVLLNSANSNAQSPSSELQAAARGFGVQLQVVRASTERDLDAVFATLNQMQVGALMIPPDPFFLDRRSQLGALALRHAIPAIHSYREFAAAGGLMSYGGSLTDAGRIMGAYTGRILKGEKPADLPVQQATRVELIINMKTAKALGLTFPITLLGRADEVIE